MNIATTYRRERHRRFFYRGCLAVFSICVLSAVIGTGVEVGLEAERQAEEDRAMSSVPFREYFIYASEQINWPWELLAALAWTESHYNPEARSHVGARGVMQLMPVTGRRFGLNDSTFLCARDNIIAGSHYIAYLQNQFRFVTDSAEQWRFVVASYNAGPAHIHDARRLARAHGDNPNRWASVEPWLERLNDPEYYTDSVVLYGSFNSVETRKHVRVVEQTYKRILSEEERIANL